MSEQTARVKTIRRAVDVQDGFFIQSRATAQDSESLSLEALGLLTYLLSKPDDWKVILSELQNTWNIGRDKVHTLIAQLIRAGYIKREQGRSGRRYGEVTYLVYGVSQHTDFQDTENPHLQNKEKKQKKEKTIAQSAKGSPTKTTKSREPDPIYESVTKHIYSGVEQPFRVGTLAGWLKGDKDFVTQNRKKCSVPELTPPASEDEIALFADWMKQRHSEIEVKQPTVVVDYFLKFRTAQSKPVIAVPQPFSEIDPAADALLLEGIG